MVGSLFPPGPGFRVAAIDNRPSQLLPMIVTPVLFAPTSVHNYHGITAAINSIGGLSVILFLFARVGKNKQQKRQIVIMFNNNNVCIYESVNGISQFYFHLII